MRLEFHRQVASDISQILDHYEDLGEAQLAQGFYSELKLFFNKAAQSTKSYAVRERDIRRVNLERFPCTFCFASLTIAYASWWFVTIEDDRRLGFAGVSIGLSNKTASEIVDHFARQRALAEGANAA
jgi:hypothetical protein